MGLNGALGALQCWAVWKCQPGMALLDLPVGSLEVLLPWEGLGWVGLVFWGSHTALWSWYLLNSASPALGPGEQLRSHSEYSGLSGFCDQYLGCDGVWMERLDGMDSEDLYIFSFACFKVFFSDYSLWFWSFLFCCFVPHSPPTENLESWNRSELRSQHDCSGRNNILSVLGQPGSGTLSKPKVYTYVIYSVFPHAVKVQLQFKPASFKRWRK